MVTYQWWIYGWTLKLLVNSKFVQTVLKSMEGKGDQFLIFTIDWRAPQSMSFPSARTTLLLDRARTLISWTALSYSCYDMICRADFQHPHELPKTAPWPRHMRETPFGRSTQVGGSSPATPSKFKIHFLIWSLKHLKHTLEKDCMLD